MGKIKEKGEYLSKHKFVFGIVLIVVVVIIIAINTLTYPQRMKKMFVQSSVDAMETKLDEEADFTNKNIEMNYEEIRLLAGLVTKYLDGTGKYSDNVLDIMSETKETAGFEQIGILKLDEEVPFATTCDGKVVKLDIWVLDVDIEFNKATVELQTSPFKTVDEGKDAVVYRYIFKDNTGAEYMLVAEKAQETLNNILNVKTDEEGLTLVMRDNGNIIYGKGNVDTKEVVSYNFWSYLKGLGAQEDLILDAKDCLQRSGTGNFKFEINGEPYHFVLQSIDNTNWICVNAYSETYLAGSNLDVVNKETMKLVAIIVVVLILVLVVSVISVTLSVRKRGEEKIVEREKLFEEMSRYIPSAFAIIQKDKKEPNFISHNFNEIVEWTLQECSLDGIAEWLGRELSKEEEKEFNENGKFRTIVEKNDKYYSVGVYDIGFIENEQHFVAIFEDVTQEVNSRRLLENSMHRAAQASESKTSFLSKMSHEIRTPLNSVIGFSKLAIDGWDTTSEEEIKGYIGKISNAGNYLLELVSDILDISRIEEGRMNVIMVSMSLDRLVDDVVNSFTGQMKRKNIQFVVDKNYENVMLKMDHFHTKQILNNLISNAYKYTDEGGCVGFEITASQLNDRQVSVQFVVQDTGIGMSEEFVGKIFEPFTQDERGALMKNQLRGSGLGMSICKNLVELLQGSIKVESEIGEGSCFTVQLIYDIASEVTEVEKEVEHNTDYSCLKGKKILAVDDISANLIVIEKLLLKYGFVFEEATNGKEAIEKFEASKENEYFAILMDVHMPIMDGYKATEEIRNMKRKDAKKVGIIAMTADAFSDDINKALMSGMNYHVTKPIEIDKVLEVLMEVYSNEVKNNEK